MDQRFVELEQRGRLENRAQLRDATRADEDGGQSEHRAIERGEIRGALSGAIADQELMPEQQRLCCDPAHAARPEEFREGDEQMDCQEEKIAHELQVITPANAHQTAL